MTGPPQSPNYDVWKAIACLHDRNGQYWITDFRDELSPDQQLVAGDRVLIMLEGRETRAVVLRPADGLDMALVKMDDDLNPRGVWRAQMRRLNILEQLAEIEKAGMDA